MEILNSLLLGLLDILLGWLLALPRDLMLMVLAIGSALGMVLIRRATTAQDRLRRGVADQRRLRTLVKEARQRKDAVAVARHQQVRRWIGLRQLRAEGRPLLWSLLPLILVAVWGWQRLEYHPLRTGEPIRLTAHFPASAAGQVVHLAPPDHIQMVDGWIQEITDVSHNGQASAQATWTLRASRPLETSLLAVRFAGVTYEQPLSVGHRRYAPPVTWHDGRLLRTEITLRPMKLFGVVPGIPPLALPPWLVAYLVLAVPAVSVWKRLLRIF